MGCPTCEAAVAADSSVNLAGTACKCQCQVKFKEAHRHAIALAIERNKRKKATPKAAAAQVATSDMLYSHCIRNLVNETVRGRQNNDGRSNDQIIQDAASSTAHMIMGDSNIVSSGAIRRGLQGEIARTTTVNYRGAGGTVQPMTLAQARKAVKGSHVPPDSKFIRNHGPVEVITIPDENRARRNSLSPVPLNPTASVGGAVAVGSGSAAGAAVRRGPPMLPSLETGDAAMVAGMKKRVRKRANRKFHNSDTSPKSKRRAARVRDGILEDDARMESAMADCEPAGSQEAYAICEEVIATPYKSN